MKLSIKGDGSDLQCVWCGNGLLAAANGESIVRIFNLETDDNVNYILNLAGLLCLASDHLARTLA